MAGTPFGERHAGPGNRDGHEPLRPATRGEVGTLIDDLHKVFERDRTVASQASSARCGLCYLHYPVAELEYRDGEGFYVCPGCRQQLGQVRIPMVRRQQQQ